MCVENILFFNDAVVYSINSHGVVVKTCYSSVSENLRMSSACNDLKPIIGGFLKLVVVNWVC